VVGALNDLLGTDALPLDPLLGPGSYSDGITWSRPPLPGSPAIDSGEQCGSLDQNGRQRRADGGTGVAQCDRGAVELNASCGAPRPTTALDPATGGTAVALQPLLVWKPTVGAVSFEVKLSTQQSPFADGIVATASDLTATHWVPDITLLPATTYYWKVVATSQCGQTSRSPVFSFTTL
jgi:hypothetical protein